MKYIGFLLLICAFKCRLLVSMSMSMILLLLLQASDTGWGFCFEEKEGRDMLGLDEGAGVRVRSVCCSCICVVEGQRMHALFPQIASLMNGFERQCYGWKWFRLEIAGTKLDVLP